MKLNTVQRWEINALARMFYEMHGYKVEIGFDFSKSQHPQERGMWLMALESYKYWVTRKQLQPIKEGHNEN